MAKSSLLYEEIRKKRVEENRKRMEELNLKSLSLHLSSKVSKPSPRKLGKPKTPKLPLELIPVRRSGRFSDKPPVSYKEVAVEPLGLGRPRSYNRRDLLNRVYASDEGRQYAISRAEQLESSLEPNLPCFVKPMLQSHVTGGFWLGLPRHFCANNLPSEDETIALEDESGDLSDTKYLAAKNGLSAGWRGFAIDHELVDGDCLVFQLVNPTRFKVYIIKVYDAEDKEDEANNEANVHELDPPATATVAKRARSEDKKAETDNEASAHELDPPADSVAKRTRSEDRKVEADNEASAHELDPPADSVAKRTRSAKK